MNKIPKLIGSVAALSSILALSPLTTAFAVEVNETTETTSVISSEVTVLESTLPVSSGTETTAVTTDISTKDNKEVEKSLPSGNGTLLEDVLNEDVNRQFLTIQSKNGNTFYLVVDKDKEGRGNVYFMNLVDEYDLMAFTDKFPNEDKDGSKKKAETAITDVDDEKPTDTEKGDNEPDSSQVKETEKAASAANTKVLVPAIGILALLGGAAFYFFKLREPSSNIDKKRDSDDNDEDIDNSDTVNDD